MTEKTHRSPLQALVSGLIGIIIFLILLIILEFIAGHTSWPLFSDFVDLLVASLPLIIIFSVIFMVGNIFEAFPFPFDLPFPVFNAVGSVLLVSFLFRILGFIGSFYSLGLAPALSLLRLILYPLVFIVVLIAGYLSISAQLREDHPEPGTPSPGGGSTATPTWDEIGDEFRKMVADLVRRTRDEINRK
jgi:hypothetical protein